MSWRRGEVQELVAGLHRHRGPGRIRVVRYHVKGTGMPAVRALGVGSPLQVGAAESVFALLHGVSSMSSSRAAPVIPT